MQSFPDIQSHSVAIGLQSHLYGLLGIHIKFGHEKDVHWCNINVTKCLSIRAHLKTFANTKGILL